MSKYRILEKKGKIDKIHFCELQYHNNEPHIHNAQTNQCGEFKSIYIPRFIVQEFEANCNKKEGNKGWGAFHHSNMPGCGTYKDLKEFTDLDEARAYKRDLELEEGIVRE